MKAVSVTILLALSISLQAASLPAREIFGLAPRLMGEDSLGFGTYADYLVCDSKGHHAGCACGFAVVPVTSTGAEVKASGISIGIGGVASMVDPQMGGRNIWPEHGKVVDVGKLPRTAKTTLKTNKNGVVYPTLWIGATGTPVQTAIESVASGISTRVLADVVLLGRCDVTSPKIGATYLAARCDPSWTKCLSRATGSSWITGGSVCSAMTMTSTVSGVFIYPMVQDDPLPTEETVDPNRLPQAQQPWPDAEWAKLCPDGTWATNGEALYCLAHDPNESWPSCLSGLDAWVYCEIIDSTMPRLARIMQDVSVGMNNCGDNRYMSDYLFFSSDEADAGRKVDNWGNPCVVLTLADGQTIEPELPDANVPDVIGSWLGTGRSDLNADGIVDGADYAISANNYGL